jgi:hypothetical protein
LQTGIRKPDTVVHNLSTPVSGESASAYSGLIVKMVGIMEQSQSAYTIEGLEELYARILEKFKWLGDYL